MAKRKRPEGVRPDRITLEYYGEAEVALVRRMRVAAVLRGERVRDWVLEAVRQRLERETPAAPAEGTEPRELPRVAEDGEPYRPGEHP